MVKFMHGTRCQVDGRYQNNGIAPKFSRQVCADAFYSCCSSTILGPDMQNLTLECIIYDRLVGYKNAFEFLGEQAGGNLGCHLSGLVRLGASNRDTESDVALDGASKVSNGAGLAVLELHFSLDALDTKETINDFSG